MNPKLSVITINFNNAIGLRQTMKSVLEQTFTDLEYIVIDGGSADGSVEVIKEFEHIKFEISESDPKINVNIPFQWISESDKGIYHAMNKGIALAKGEYCFFINSGDYFVSPNVVKSVFSEGPEESIIFGNLIIGLNNKITGKIRGKSTLTFFDLYKSNVVKHQSAFIKRKLFEVYGLYNENLKIVADWEFFLKTLGFANESYRYMDIDIAYFDNDGISSNAGNVTINERNHVLQTIVPPMILPDYRQWERYNFLIPVFRYKPLIFLLRVIAKCTKEIEKIRGIK